MEISVDVTFAIQIVSFFVLWVVLRKLLFEPMIEVLEKREDRTRGSLEAASHIHSDVEAMRADYQEHLRNARQKSLEDMEASRKLTIAEERTILSAARDQAAARLAVSRVEIGKQVDAARAVLDRDSSALAGQLVEKVVGRQLA